MKQPRKIKRGAIRRERCVFVGAWVPHAIANGVDRAVEAMDSDRSKFMRRALEEKIAKEGL